MKNVKLYNGYFFFISLHKELNFCTRCTIKHLVNSNHQRKFTYNVYAIFCLIWDFFKQADTVCKHIHVSNVHVQDKQNRVYNKKIIMFYIKNQLLIIQSQWWPQSSSSEVVGTMLAVVTFRRFGHWLWRISTILGLTCVPSKFIRERLSDFKQDTPTKSRLLMWKFNTSTPKMYSNHRSLNYILIYIWWTPHPKNFLDPPWHRVRDHTMYLYIYSAKLKLFKPL